MNHRYIKDFPRGTKKELHDIGELLPVCTDHLNTLNSSLNLICRLKVFAFNGDNEIGSQLADIEAQGTFNTYLTSAFWTL